MLVRRIGMAAVGFSALIGIGGAVVLGLRPSTARAWEGDVVGDGNLFNNEEQEQVVANNDWLQLCLNANTSVSARENFCRALPSWWTGTRSRCWSHTNDGSFGWSNWCHNEFD